ncbi:MAG TPA: ATP-binding protein [Gemmataceae bacterium]|nr:ATP-binding protein [Gemmataceae bacterium]
MKSIRLALIVYFLLLLGCALGGVSWFVYQTASNALHAKEAGNRDHLKASYQAECEKARASFDRRLFEQAQVLRGKVVLHRDHYETLAMLAALGWPAMPDGHLSMPLLLAEGLYDKLGSQIWFRQPLRIEAMEMSEEPRVFFQFYNDKGRVLERSSTLDESLFSLDASIRTGAEEQKEGYFDTVRIGPELTVRRVTWKTNIWRIPSTQPTIRRLWEPTPFVFNPQPKAPKAPPPRGGFQLPILFIQFAKEPKSRDATLATLRTKLDEDLAKEEGETRQTLAGLRKRLSWIFGLTFLAIVIGGALLIRLGLTPLRRLSDAVSRVSERDFRLQIDQSRLPTELRPIAGRLAQTLEQLKRAFAREKQAAADISHELRTPLAALMTTVEVALRKPRKPEEYQEILEDCRASGKQMTQLVEKLLALARLDAGADHLRLRAVDMSNLAGQCAEMVRPLAEARGIKMNVRVSDLSTIETDPDKLREVLTNLLHNAVEYNRPDGSIDLAVERQNGHLCLEVRDTGIGIAPDAREHIFERFFRADPSRHADTLHAGIGLAIVKGYVDLMGGTIGVESSSAGSTFRVELPVRS